MTKISGYQGWHNWATWNVALWVGNTEHVYREMRLLRPFTPLKARHFVERIYPRGTPDWTGPRKTFPPYVGENAVNWQEIADDFNSD